MSKRKETNEKREYARLKDEGISLKVKSGDIDIITKSLDISASGVYCKVEKEVPLLSRVKIILIIPKAKKSDTEDTLQTVKIETDGVVVREHPVITNGKVTHYDVAIFFDNISAKDREALLEYIGKKSETK